MRVLGMFFWIVVGAIILWFFSMNLNEYVTIRFFYRSYPDINLILVIFVSFFIGTVIGAILLSPYVFGARTQIRSLKREKSKLLKELDGLRNMSIDEIPDLSDENLSEDSQEN